MANFERQQEFEASQNERLKKDISRLQKAAKRSAIWSDKVEASKVGAADKGYVGHKAAKMMKRSKVIEARQQQAIEQKSGLLKNAETADVLKIQPLEYHTDMLVSFSDVVVISYVAQDTSHLTGTLSEFAEKNNLNESLFKAVLRKMDFERVQFEKDMKDFSQGQKKKVLIAKSLCEQAHLYVWDEPLNFIDVYSRIQIERLIEQFAPTMLLVEHDAAFREKIATKVVEL